MLRRGLSSAHLPALNSLGARAVCNLLVTQRGGTWCPVVRPFAGLLCLAFGHRGQGLHIGELSAQTLHLLGFRRGWVGPGVLP
jgi:hypothetical protein